MQELSADDTLVTAAEAATILGVSLRTVKRIQADGDLTPIYLQAPRRAKLCRFRRSDVEALKTRPVSA